MSGQPAEGFAPPLQSSLSGSAGHALDPLDLALRLYLVANALLVIFIATVLNAALPLRLVDPRWQQGLIQSLLSQGLVPLIALVLLHLAVVLNPASSRLRRRRARFSTYAVAAAIGFLLLIPLQLASSWGSLNQLASRQSQQRSEGLAVVSQLRQAIITSTSHQQLDQRLRALPIRITGPAPASDLALPFAQRQQKMLAGIARSEDQLRIAAAASTPPIPWSGLIEAFLRVAPTALALAFTYAVMAWIAGSSKGEAPLQTSGVAGGPVG